MNDKEKGIICFSHRSLKGNGFSLEGPNSVVYYPSIPLEDTSKDGLGEFQTYGDLKNVDLWQRRKIVVSPLRMMKGSFLPCGGYTLDTWSPNRDSQQNPQHFHLTLESETVMNEQTKLIFRQMSVEDKERIKDEMSCEFPKCIVTSHHGIYLIPDADWETYEKGGVGEHWDIDEEARIIDEEGDLAAYEFLCLDEKEVKKNGEWQSEVPVRLQLETPPYFYEAAMEDSLMFSINGKLARVNFFTGLRFGTPDLAKITPLVKRLVGNGDFGEEEVRKIVNPFIRVVARFV